MPMSCVRTVRIRCPRVRWSRSLSSGRRAGFRRQPCFRSGRSPRATHPPIEELGEIDRDELARLPFLPARVKWYDRLKGFGFANVFGNEQDVFLHAEVLRRAGFADLQPGEALAVRVIEGRRGKMAAQVVAWDAVLRMEPPAEA